MSEPSLLRTGDDASRVTNVELFYDLVYVFAVTQLSHVLVAHPTVGGALEAAVLLAMVWQVWVYTTWAINYLEPARDSVRAMLLVLMLGSLVLAAEVPGAFRDRGTVVAVVYVSMQVGRCMFVIWALRGEQLQRAFWRILPWSTATGVVVLVGAAAHGHVREALWALAVLIDLIAAALGFYVPGLGRSQTSEWTISGAHFAERCQAFVLIALGESIVIIGAHLYGFGRSPDAAQVAAFGCAFVANVALWWIYFDRAAEDSSAAIEESADPGRLARDAFHWVHPAIVAGVIVGAAADEKLFDAPHARSVATAWLLLGGAALYLAGHAAFKAIVWRRLSWQRVLGVVALLLLLLLASHVSSLVIAFCALAVVVGVAIADRIQLGPA